jgi:putative pyruvate formate lyase activating enzyme
VLSGQAGSGTIFFSGCNLKCRFCQNYQLSWEQQGQEVSAQELAERMLALQEQGAANINLVTPTHHLPAILAALDLSLRRGLNVPIVYNSSGYEKAGVLRHLEGIVDIYLPDLKYHSPLISQKYSGAPDYFEAAAPAIIEMYCQQARLEINARGYAQKGVIIRHLILPGHTDDSLKVLQWLADNLSPMIGLSVMSQFHPCYQAPPEIQRSLSTAEYKRVTDQVRSWGFQNLYLQPAGFSPKEHLIPDFERDEPFLWGDKDRLEEKT